MNEIEIISKKYIKSMGQNCKWALSEYEKTCKLMVEKNCTFAGNVIPFLLKPHFITEYQENILKNLVFHIVNAFEKLIDYSLKDKKFRKSFGFHVEELELFKYNPGYKKNIIIARLDGFLSHTGRIKFIECNSDSPAGPGYSDTMASIFKDLIPVKKLNKQYRFYNVNRKLRLLRVILKCFSEFKKRKKPNIAIVDWKDVGTRSEFIILKDYFTRHGLKTVIADPRELIFRNGRLTYKNFSIDLIYKRLIIREALDKKDELKDFFKAYKSGKICFINSFRSLIAGNKLVMAFATDEKYQRIFSDVERKIIQEHIPWTRKLEKTKLDYKGKTIDLIDYIIKNRKKFIIKAAEGYGGKKVFVGYITGQNEWEEKINKYIKDNWIVQEVVDIPVEKFPVIDKNFISWHERYINLNPLVFRGEYGGSFARISKSPVINVSSGGGLVPTISVSKKI